jgi:hypothetical protein
MADQVGVFVWHYHSPEDDAFTAHLVADLEAAGADVWVDNARITSDDFINKISQGLAGRQWLVLVMTPHAVRSPRVQREVNVTLNEHTAGRMLGCCAWYCIRVPSRTFYRSGAPCIAMTQPEEMRLHEMACYAAWRGGIAVYLNDYCGFRQARAVPNS